LTLPRFFPVQCEVADAGPALAASPAVTMVNVASAAASLRMWCLPGEWLMLSVSAGSGPVLSVCSGFAVLSAAWSLVGWPDQPRTRHDAHQREPDSEWYQYGAGLPLIGSKSSPQEQRAGVAALAAVLLCVGGRPVHSLSHVRQCSVFSSAPSRYQGEPHTCGLPKMHRSLWFLQAQLTAPVPFMRAGFRGAPSREPPQIALAAPRFRVRHAPRTRSRSTIPRTEPPTRPLSLLSHPFFCPPRPAPCVRWRPATTRTLPSASRAMVLFYPRPGVAGWW
jgi:hypothetical protein